MVKKAGLLKKIGVVLLFTLLFPACSNQVEKSKEKLEIKELEAVKEVRVGGSSAGVKTFFAAGSMFIPANQKGTKGKVFLQTLGEENNQESVVGIERFVPGGKDGVYLVDHPPGVHGARVQKFSFPVGKLLAVKFLPPSTLFTTDGKGGFIYHHPAGVLGGEGLVMVEDGRGKVKERLSVSPDVNVGAVYINSEDVWVLEEGHASPGRVFPAEVPIAYYYPVLVGLKTQRRVEANYLGWDGKFYFFGSREVHAATGKPAMGSYFLFGPVGEGSKPQKKIVFPWEANLVGVDKKGYIYVLREREISSELDSENRAEHLKAPRFVYRVSPEGKVTHVLNLDSFLEPGMYKKIYVWVSPEGEIWSLSESLKGVRISKFALSPSR